MTRLPAALQVADRARWEPTAAGQLDLAPAPSAAGLGQESGEFDSRRIGCLHPESMMEGEVFVEPPLRFQDTSAVVSVRGLLHCIHERGRMGHRNASGEW